MPPDLVHGELRPIRDLAFLLGTLGVLDDLHVLEQLLDETKRTVVLAREHDVLHGELVRSPGGLLTVFSVRYL